MGSDVWQLAVEMVVVLEDDFGDDRRPGDAIGSMTRSDDRRGGVDAEGRISIDHGALRIAQLSKPGWGRAALAYGPFAPRCGLALAMHITNGHNSSENTDRWPGMARWGVQWLRGTQSDSPVQRLTRRRSHPSRVSLAEQMRAVRSHHQIDDDDTLDENMAVGWFGSEVPIDPARDGHGFVMRALGPENGRLEARHGDRLTALVRGVQNIPIHYVAVLRERGSILYAGSLPGALGLRAHPTFRPVAIDETPHATTVWAGVHQSVLGQVGWLVDTRVHEARIVDLQPTPPWFMSAIVADRDLSEPIEGSVSDTGGTWTAAVDGSSVLDPEQPIGLIHATFGTEPGPRSIVWRHDGDQSGWFFTIDGLETKLEVRHGAEAIRIVTGTVVPAANTHAHVVQILDDGSSIRITVDGATAMHLTDADLVADPSATDNAYSDCIGFAWDSVVPETIEAHPRAVTLPSELLTTPSWHRYGDAEVVNDDFSITDDHRGQDLATRTSPQGQRWERTIGPIPYVLDGDGVLVDVDAVPIETSGRLRDKLASAIRPTGRRTAYTVAWDEPGFADISSRIVAPGTGPGDGQEGRGGLILWQDPDNFLILNTWLEDSYGGASVSSFFRIDGFEELYDAVWTNVGERIVWGREYELRMTSDGDHYLVYLDGEPILHRRLTDVYPTIERLKITRVGIVTNWEFGDDTGSRFRSFIARTS